MQHNLNDLLVYFITFCLNDQVRKLKRGATNSTKLAQRRNKDPAGEVQTAEAAV